MAVIKRQDIAEGRRSLELWNAVASGKQTERLRSVDDLPRRVWAMAVRYSLHLLETRIPGEGVEVRVAPWGAIKVLDGPASDPHNLTPPDVIELEPDVWLRLACGLSGWNDEKEAGHITAVGERDDLSPWLPLTGTARGDA